MRGCVGLSPESETHPCFLFFVIVVDGGYGGDVCVCGIPGPVSMHKCASVYDVPELTVGVGCFSGALHIFQTGPLTEPESS